jgi:hypothetical protein
MEDKQKSSGLRDLRLVPYSLCRTFAEEGRRHYFRILLSEDLEKHITSRKKRNSGDLTCAVLVILGLNLLSKGGVRCGRLRIRYSIACVFLESATGAQ